MFEIILAVNYIEPLLCVVSLSTPVAPDFLLLLRNDVGCMIVANAIKGNPPEETRKFFNIVNDFTPEEEVHGLIRCLNPPSDPLFYPLLFS